jgi:site-specific DNA-cytosine methylase
VRAVDCLGFAGGFACGVREADFHVVAKREPAEFSGFGVGAVEANMPGVDIQVDEPEFWRIVRGVEMVFGNPPCSGFSNLSAINTAERVSGRLVEGVRLTQRGIDSPDNAHMFDFIDYAAKTKPEIAIFESVPAAGKMGLPLMRRLWQRLLVESEVDYDLTHVFMNSAILGGDVIRPRYFFVAHRRPFGVDLPKFGPPRSLMEVIGDLPAEEDLEDLDWGHQTNHSASSKRIAETIEIFRAHGYDWREGTRLPENLQRFKDQYGQPIPDSWKKADGTYLSHAVGYDTIFSPFRWYSDKPMGVVTGGTLERGVHPVHPRTFTYREAARLMGLPDWWTLRPYVVGKHSNWLGKGITVAAGRWIATWARASVEGRPGEYIGLPDADNPRERFIDVTTAAKVESIERGQSRDPVWIKRTRDPIIYSPPSLYERTLHPESEYGFAPDDEAVLALRGPKPPRPPKVGPRGGDNIERITPDRVNALLKELRMSRTQAALALGCSVSRVVELTTTRRPRAWLNAERWGEVEQTLRAHATPAKTSKR